MCVYTAILHTLAPRMIREDPGLGLMLRATFLPAKLARACPSCGQLVSWKCIT